MDVVVLKKLNALLKNIRGEFWHWIILTSTA